ncbi:MAG: nuclear transport factor 2 family protein [Deltaproteobacteria bacterium]
MKRKVLVVLAAGLLIAAGKDEGAVKEIQQSLQTLNEAFARGDAEAIRRLTADEHVAITPYYGGPMPKTEQLKNPGDLKVPDYKAGEIKVTLLTKDTALVIYPLTQKGTYKGKPVAARNYVAAVWVNRDGKWLEASYQETPLGETK